MYSRSLQDHVQCTIDNEYAAPRLDDATGVDGLALDEPLLSGFDDFICGQRCRRGDETESG
jgi:hypothetical protein